MRSHLVSQQIFFALLEIYYICFLLIYYDFNKSLQFLMYSKDLVNFTAVGDWEKNSYNGKF